MLYAGSLTEKAEKLQERLPDFSFISLEGPDFLRVASPEPSRQALNVQSSCEDEDATALILFTSGTMSGSRGVALSRRNIYSIQQYSFIGAGFLPEDRTSVILPLHHSFGSLAQVDMPLFVGGAVCLIPSLKRLSRQLRELEISILPLVPAMARALLWELDAREPQTGTDAAELLRSIRMVYSGGAPLSIEILEGLRAHGVPIAEGYGATECGGLISVYKPEVRRFGTVGRAYPCCSVRIAPDGEIQVSGENVMSGYWKDPEATRSVMTPDGWFCTGDIGRLSEDGYLTVLGRKKSVILLDNGKKVFPEELEAMLEGLAPIEEALVYGKNNCLCARIYTRDQEAARRVLDDWSRSQPDWRRPGSVEFCQEPFPRTNTGKKLRRSLP